MALVAAEVFVEDHHSSPVGCILFSAPVAFGSAENHWLYLPNSRKFDLSRGSERKLIIECDEARHNHCGFMIDPGSTVLVVVDMQIYFVNTIYQHHTAGLAAVGPIFESDRAVPKRGYPDRMAELGNRRT